MGYRFTYYNYNPEWLHTDPTPSSTTPSDTGEPDSSHQLHDSPAAGQAIEQLPDYLRASDMDRDTLTYSWSALSGTIIGTGDIVEWIAPETPGKYPIKVKISDGNGGEATDSVIITVADEINSPPTVSLVVTLTKESPVIVKEGDQFRVRRWSVVKIECLAEDPDGDELSFEWSATEGLVQGEGAIVDYIARATGDQAVTVIVTDSNGGKIQSSVYFEVPCCGAQ